MLFAALLGSQLPTILVLMHITAENIQTITKINTAVFTIKAVAHFILSATWVFFLNGNNKTFRQAVESAITAPILVLTLLQGNPYNTNNSAVPQPTQPRIKIEKVDTPIIKNVSYINTFFYNDYGCAVSDKRNNTVPIQSSLSWLWETVTSPQITEVNNTGFAVLTPCVYEDRLADFISVVCKVAEQYPIAVYKCPYNTNNYTISFGTRLTHEQAKEIKKRFTNTNFDLWIYEEYK